MRFLCHLSKFSDVNKMSASNLAVILAPNLLWPRGDTGSVVALVVRVIVVILVVLVVVFQMSCLSTEYWV